MRSSSFSFALLLGLGACAEPAVIALDAGVRRDAATQPGQDGSTQVEEDGSIASENDAGVDPLDGSIEEPDAEVDLTFTRYPGSALRSPITPSVVASMRAIASDTLWDDVFMKVGASNTVNTNFLTCFGSAGTTDLGTHTELAEAVEHFRAGSAAGGNPYARVSLSARVGASSNWAIEGDPSPLEQEYEALLPQFAVVLYGTNDMEQGGSAPSALPTFYDNYNALLDQIIARGVVPIVTGLSPRRDNDDDKRWVPTFDALTRAIAETRQLPYISWFNGIDSLPNAGLIGDGLHGNAYSGGACQLTADGLQYGFNVRNLLTLQTLDAVWRTLSRGEAAPDAPPAAIAGSGTQADPFVIDRLPFTHYADTSASSESRIDTYPVCSTGQDESGPEIYYRVNLPASTRARFVVMDLGTTDVDVHVIDNGGTCRKRGHHYAEGTFSAGDYTIVVDSFTSDGVPKSGAYTFLALACADGDARCN